MLQPYKAAAWVSIHAWQHMTDQLSSRGQPGHDTLRRTLDAG